jgi:hypothetical protein
MILLSLGLVNEHIVPRHTKMDRIDHTLMLILKIGLIVLFVTLPQAFAEDEPGDEFWLSCSGGNTEAMEKALEQHPSKLYFVSCILPVVSF